MTDRFPLPLTNERVIVFKFLLDVIVRGKPPTGVSIPGAGNGYYSDTKGPKKVTMVYSSGKPLKKGKHRK